MTKLLIVIIIVTLFACNHSPQKHTIRKTDQLQNVFPVANFIEAQIHDVDSLKLPLIKTITKNNTSSTSVISAHEFKAIAHEFINPDISDESIKNFYKETSFADQSIPNATLTYEATDKNLAIQRIDVIIHPDTASNDKVDNIYIEKYENKNDSFFVKKLLWSTDKNLEVITTVQASSGPSTTTQVKISWEKQY